MIVKRAYLVAVHDVAMAGASFALALLHRFGLGGLFRRDAGVEGNIDVGPPRLEDLLGRPQATPDRAAMRALVSGRRVCITGAGGTIGAELARQIAGDGPAHLTLIDNSEYNLYRIDLELEEAHPDLSRSTVLGDVRDPGSIAATFSSSRPELVFHAAALKHVHMVETNPNEGVLTNAVGTRNVADASVVFGVRLMVLVSTDKSVDPTSVMGATKRIAESYCQALADAPAAGGLRLVTVRFGNVIGSSGSAVPRFQRQIAAGGPVTVTDPEAARYFMTTREAVQLLLQASALGAREEGGGIYALDMGKPIKIVDLARRMIRRAGLVPGKDIEIVFTGLRPGEKKDESLFHSGRTYAGDRDTRAYLIGLGRAPPMSLSCGDGSTSSRAPRATGARQMRWP